MRGEAVGPEQEIGWFVTDPDGNVVASGPITKAEMTAELLQMLGIPPTPEGA